MRHDLLAAVFVISLVLLFVGIGLAVQQHRRLNGLDAEPLFDREAYDSVTNLYLGGIIAAIFGAAGLIAVVCWL